MAQQINNAAKRTLAKYARHIGGVDEDGNEHFAKLDPDALIARQKQHIFCIKNTELANSAYQFITGDVLEDKVKEKKYTVEYVGMAKGIKTNKVYKNLLIKQEHDLIDGLRAYHERQGLFNEDSYYDEMKEAVKNSINEEFEKRINPPKPEPQLEATEEESQLEEDLEEQTDEQVTASKKGKKK